MTPHRSTPVGELPLLALDLETTGLSVGRDRILAVGVVPVDGTRIELAGARRLLVDHDDPGEAVAIHGLTHDDLEGGRPLAEVLEEVHELLAGRALLAHHAPFDQAFLDAGLRSVGMAPLRVPVVCTLDLQRRLLTRGGEELPRGALRLWRAREAHGMARAPAHDALGDALACAELYLAQLAELGSTGQPLLLRDVRRHEPWPRRLRRVVSAWWR
ncbi:3'-5' exonuclease [Nocardioides coralli]|uniref:3'-5' exonuclease n=1 Tax=Nocardioides coralli TaxID=2872154 RepID=UPI001CA440AF|nr:3'-5' exonuclease [Nocardioides coralli]QZY28216.1 3'-5' exonuclease [Nocardioides coralli]